MSLVLIADDEEPTLEILAEVVSNLGHQVLLAHDGDEALLLARSHGPDLIITDFMMPGRTGIELIRMLRTETALSSIPVILMSAASPGAAGEATLFLAKPLHLSEFEVEVARLLGPKTGARPADAPVAVPIGASGRRPEALNWVAHELKSPLSAVRMSLELLRRRLAIIGDDQDRSRMAIALRGLDRMTELINSVLDAAALGEGRVTLTRERVDIAAFLQRMVTLWRDLHPEVEFMLQLPSDRLELLVDAPRLERVIDNLLSNAVKYGGERKRVELSVTPSLSQLVISVRDYGQGIAAADLPHLFERFHRAEGSSGDGHGLGLFIAAAVAKLHGGTLTAKSQLGSGATFSLTLPRAA